MLRIKKRDSLSKSKNKSRIYPSLFGDNSCNNIIINENIISILLNKPLMSIKPLYKIKDCDFTLIKYCEYENIININYNLTQLKTIAKFYNLKLSGNKDEVKKILPELKGFHVLSWGGLGEPLLNKDIYELTKEARKYIPIVKTTSNGTTLVKKIYQR